MAGLLTSALCILQLLLYAHAQSDACSHAEYDRCVRVADPLVREAHLVFPDNMEDIVLVCKTWNRFVDCIDRYTNTCFTDQQRREFNKAVENPIESVHKMCMHSRYQKEYLRYAPCIKSTITERTHCGPQYSFLVEQVEQGGVISKTTLCCSYEKFRECVQRETRQVCDRGMNEGAAAQFSSQILDKAFSFLQDQCYNYIPNSGDCPTLTTDALPYFDPLAVSVSSSEVYPWSTIQDTAPKEPREPATRYTSISWMPSTIADQSSSLPDSRVLGSRTRPASYGRSGSWADPQPTQNTQPVANSVHVYSEPMSSPSSPSYSSEQAPTAWYPVAGNQLVNEVEEPNQQGLAKPRNGAAGRQLFSLTIIATVLTTYC